MPKTEKSDAAAAGSSSAPVKRLDTRSAAAKRAPAAATLRIETRAPLPPVVRAPTSRVEVVTQSERTTATTTKTASTSQIEAGPRGRRVSARPWKAAVGERHALAKQDKALHPSWAAKEAERARKAALRAKVRALRAEREADEAAARARRAAKRTRTEENVAKNEVYHTITNPHKIKRMTKKQMRSIKKIV